jgi:hypothetical protein
VFDGCSVFALLCVVLLGVDEHAIFR